MRNKHLLGIALLLAGLAGCYVVPIDSRQPAPPPAVVALAAPGPVTLTARLYPVNEIASKLGILSAQATDNLNGRGTFSLVANGEMLQGEATRINGDYPGFGSIHQKVVGDGRLPSGRRGIANAAGPRGTYINCEYVLTGEARGVGACLLSNGAKYQMHFGG